MAVDELLINTGVDMLIKLVSSRGRIEIAEAASELGVSRSALEEWARILEDEGIVRIEYRLTKVYLVWITKTRAQVEEKVERIAEEKVSLKRKAETIFEKVSGRGKELDEMQQDFAKVSKLYDAKLIGIKGKLEELRAVEKERNALYERFSKMDDVAGEQLKKIEGEVKRIEAGVKGARKEAGEIDEELVKIEANMARIKERSYALGNKIQKMLAQVKEGSALVVEREKDVGKIKSESAGLLEELKKEIKEMERVKAEYGMEYSKIEGENERLAKRIAGMKELLDRDIDEERGAVKKFDELLERKGDIEKFILELQEERKKIAEEIVLLCKEIELLKMQAEPGAIEGVQKKMEEIEGKMKGAERRHLEFEKKRAQLGEIIKKLLK